MNVPDLLIELLTALGVGLLIGVVRERRHQPDVTKAGTRTHALVAVLASSALATTILAMVSGGFRYGLTVGAGLLVMVAGGAMGVWWLV